MLNKKHFVGNFVMENTNGFEIVELNILRELGFNLLPLCIAWEWFQQGVTEAGHLDTMISEAEAASLGLTKLDVTDNYPLRQAVDNAIEKILSVEVLKEAGWGDHFQLLTLEDQVSIALWVTHLAHNATPFETEEFIKRIKVAMGLIDDPEDLDLQDFRRELRQWKALAEEQNNLYKDQPYDGADPDDFEHHEIPIFKARPWRIPWGKLVEEVQDKELYKRLKEEWAIIRGRLIRIGVSVDIPKDYKDIQFVCPKGIKIDKYTKQVDPAAFMTVAKGVIDKLKDGRWRPPVVFVSNLKDGRDVVFWNVGTSPKGSKVWVQMEGPNYATVGFVSRFASGGQKSPLDFVNDLLSMGWITAGAVVLDEGRVRIGLQWVGNGKPKYPNPGSYRNVWDVKLSVRENIAADTLKKGIFLGFTTRIKPQAFGSFWKQKGRKLNITGGWKKEGKNGWIESGGANWIRLDLPIRKDPPNNGPGKPPTPKGGGYTTIIAGSRSITSTAVVEEAIRRSGFKIAAVISGDAPGVDRIGAKWALKNNIPVVHMPAKWDKHGKKAGFIRNEEMAARADALIAVWDGKSPGTAHMIKVAKQRGLKVFVYKTGGPEILTSWFANVRKLRQQKPGWKLVSIARYTPRDVQVDQHVPELAPSPQLLHRYKYGLVSPQEYEKEFIKQLQTLDPKKWGRALQRCVLLCYEKPGEFCHRHLVAAWLRQAGFSVAEYSG